MNLNILPTEIIDYIETLVYKLMLKDSLKMIPAKKVKPCKGCIKHTAPCMDCAYYKYRGRYGPGNFEGVQTFIVTTDRCEDYYDKWTYHEMLGYILQSGKNYRYL
jgi:hypothetical protein